MGEIVNDATVEALIKMSLSHVAAGRRLGGAKRHDGWPDRGDTRSAGREQLYADGDHGL